MIFDKSAQLLYSILLCGISWAKIKVGQHVLQRVLASTFVHQLTAVRTTACGGCGRAEAAGSQVDLVLSGANHGG